MAETKKTTTAKKTTSTAAKKTTTTTTKKKTTAKKTTSKAAKKTTTAKKKTTASNKTTKPNNAKKQNVLISVKNLGTKFKEKHGEKIVHSDLSLDVYENEVLSIIGSNGAGKTVLVETIVGVRGIQKGSIESAEGFSRFDDVGIQFQTEDNTSGFIRPRHLIDFYRKFYGKKIDEEELSKMIEIFGIKEFVNKKMNKLSGGQRQRVNLLLATMAKPKLLILDEFTTGLDIASVIDILDYIMDLKKRVGMTLVVVTHSAKEIKMLADRVVLIQDGIVKTENSHSDIDKKYNSDFDQFLIDQIRGVK